MKSFILKPKKYCQNCGLLLDAGRPQEADSGDYTEIVATCNCGHENVLRRFWHVIPPRSVAVAELLPPKPPKTWGYLIYIVDVKVA